MTLRIGLEIGPQDIMTKEHAERIFSTKAIGMDGPIGPFPGQAKLSPCANVGRCGTVLAAVDRIELAQ